ncbi:hypothetical protein nbrc107696_14150 [Gordonia spumicola]|uniref:DUF1023 domain-containing protein n=1 Tax=Gordonia spumicola TaxID=589161 RepID=A0A7I9V6C2_9ACTN|nr:alpha/beta hydrolase [Gordonia spumicola]GEE00969.1 hypothetical protein nbrc107696_14150 [Gordonia spumicola]
MSLTVDEVIGWDLTGLPAAAASLTVLADQLLDAGRAAVNSASSDPEWRGVTKDAALTRITAVRTSLGRTSHTVDDAATAVKTAFTQLSDMQGWLRGTVVGLRAEGYVVAGDGTVTHSDADHRARALDATEQVQTVFDRAVALDGTRAASLTGRAAQLTGTDKSTVVLPDGAALSPTDAVAALARMSEAERRTAWESFSDSERDEMLKSRPAVIGNMNGVPFQTRIVANEMTLRAALRAAETRRWIDGEDDAKRLRSMLADGRKFISLDLPNGRFAELIGEITPATTNVGVFVPGTGTAIDDVDSLRTKAQSLNKQSGAPIIVWADAVFPQMIVGDPRKVSLDRMAASNELAVADAPRLVAFGRELDAEIATTAPGAKTTVIGHSYGGSIVGSAEQLGLRADRVVYASSAGTGAFDHTPWSNPQDDVKRYSLTPPGDPIQYVQDAGRAVHGGDPDTMPGVTRIDSGYLSADEDGTRRLLQGLDSHGAYLDDPGSDAFHALSDVIAGREPAPYVHRTDDVAPGTEIPLRGVGAVGEIAEDVADGVKGIVGGLLRLAG